MILNGFNENKDILKFKKIFLVCGKSFDRLDFANYIQSLNPIRFSDFRPNPLYEEVLNGVEAFNNSCCDTILAVGGGSALDVAKAIKYFSEKEVEIIAIPTTSGTGSESTHFSVIYKDGEKISLASQAILPEIVILEPSSLEYVPEYTRKVTLMDALCHCIESFWSKKSTDESRELAVQGIKNILEFKDAYLKNEKLGNAGMMLAANLAGQAINLTTTTAAHAMSYKLTSLYGIAHGHAVALCLPEVWKTNKTIIPSITIEQFYNLLEELGLNGSITHTEKDIDILVNSVNLERLSNNPVVLKKEMIREMYERILR